ncbi:MAG: glycosyltransferase family 1 protein [Leptospira sp.]|nr:glycosyltransferase family 1 protein [Leptospira sp.]
MKLGIDVRPLAYGVTGNSRYLAETLRRMIPKHKNVQFYFYSNKPIHPIFEDLINHSNVVLRIEDKSIPGPIYLHFFLPRRIKKDNIVKFWATLQLLPFFKLNIPTFVNYHDLNFISAPETMAKWNYYQHKFFSPRTLKIADRIFCLSKNTFHDIEINFPFAKNKCVVIFPGVVKRNFKKIKNVLPTNFFLTVGTLEPRKNIKRLTTAFQNFKIKNPKDKHSLLILGRKGWGEEGMELFSFLTSDTAKKLSIQFIENPSDDLLGQAIHECESFFFPSLHEGFGLPLLEAMIENKRCIASNIPVFKEILEDKNDLYVDPFDTEKWEMAFEEVSKFKTKNRIPKFKETNWSWDRTTQLLEKELLK